MKMYQLNTISSTVAKTSLSHALVVVALTMAMAETASSQLVLTSTNYAQDFNSISSALPTGWSVLTNASLTNLGTAASFTTAATSWGASAGQFANHASTVGNSGTNFLGNEPSDTQSAATNRCPGVRLTGSFGDPGAAFVLQIQDTIGISNLTFSLDFNLLRSNANSTVWTLDYGVGNSPASFASLGTITDPGVFGSTNQSFHLGADADNQFQNVWIRVVALSGSTGGGTRDTFGIDNFVLAYSNTNTPPPSTPPVITSEPQSRTNNAGTEALFTVGATGTPSPSYQWKRHGTNLVNNGHILGATAAALEIFSVTKPDEGPYSCWITNIAGFTNTDTITLTVIDPAINVQPHGATNIVGDRQVFSISAAGTAPLRYQWRKNGADIEGETGTSITFPNVVSSDAADYTVCVFNSLGVVTSSVAKLALITTPSVLIAQWDFNSNPPDTNTQTGLTTPRIGSGTASLAGGVTESFSGGPAAAQDPASPSGDNSSWVTTDYPPRTNDNKSAGAQFSLSTAGYQDVLLTWHQRHSGTASRYCRVQYTTNGTDWLDEDVITITDTDFNRVTVDLSSIPSANDNSSFAFRVVAEFENTATGSGGTNYVATSTGSSYSGGQGTIRFDWLNVFANPTNLVTTIPLNIVRIGDDVVLHWGNAAFSLQAAPLVTGTYTNVPGATSPYTNSPAAEQKFFRLVN